ncbi:MAG: LuxR C-terminal-related transcriptional regulator [Bacteroidales bacterium]
MEKKYGVLPGDTPYFYREFAAGWYAFAQRAPGRASAGLNRLESEYRTLADADEYFRIRLLRECILYLFEANTTYLYNDGSSLANICSPNKYLASWVIGIYSMASHSYLNNHLEKVSRFHDDLRLHRYLGRPFWIIHYFFIECLSAMAGELWQKVEHCIADCEQLAGELAIEPLIGMVKAFQVEYHLRRHEVERAREVAALANFEPHPPLFFYYIPQLTKVKLLFRTHQEEKGQEMLDNLLELGRVRHNKNLLIQALALQAVIHAGEGNMEAAKKVLNEVLLVTKDTKNIRTLLDHGEAMLRIIKEMLKDEPQSSRIYEILQAFENELPQDFKDKSKPTANREKQINDLSNRELEILALVAQGLKNSEIADRLFVSTDTVKKHLYNAYQKLEVTNRTGALKKVKLLGLVTSKI